MYNMYYTHSTSEVILFTHDIPHLHNILNCLFFFPLDTKVHECVFVSGPIPSSVQSQRDFRKDHGSLQLPVTLRYAKAILQLLSFSC